MWFFRFLQELWPPRSHFSTSDIPDLTGKVAIVTGANTGVGKETARALLEHNAHVYVACRSKEKAEAAIKDLHTTTGQQAKFLHLDLADLASVKRAAEEFIAYVDEAEQELHMLVNNAAVMHCPMDMMSAQNYDLQFATNVLGHFYFTNLLISLLLKTAKTSTPFKPRIIHTSSSGAYAVAKVNLSTLIEGPARKSTNTFALYSYSKLGNALISKEFAGRYGDQGIVSVSLNPGNLDSDLTRHYTIIRSIPFLWDIARLGLYSCAQGALTQLWAGTAPEGNDMNGKFLIPWARYGDQPAGVLLPNEAQELWGRCEEQIQKFQTKTTLY